MRKNLPITSNEQRLTPDSFLVSRTDTKGILKYCNEEFITISGFSEEELIGTPHNIIRHPDVPPVIFKEMWSTLSEGLPWMGIVKNRCKNGDYYWVNAYVTPIKVDNHIQGFESVRTLATEQQQLRAQIIYERLQHGKKKATPNHYKIPPLFIGIASYLLLIGITIPSAHYLPLVWSLPLSVISALLIGFLFSLKLTSESKHLIKIADTISSSTVAQYMYTGKVSQTSAIQTAFYALQRRRTVLHLRINQTIGQVHIKASKSQEKLTTIQLQNQQQSQNTSNVTEQISILQENTTNTLQNISEAKVLMDSSLKLGNEGEVHYRRTAEDSIIWISTPSKQQPCHKNSWRTASQ